MKNNPQNSPYKSQNKDKVLILKNIVETIEKGTGLELHELKKKYHEELLFNIALKHVTTTKKALCEALTIPVEAGCRYKREYEKRGLLKQSLTDVICPYTKHPARLISTNTDEFERLSYTNQLRMF
jgi:hypothetical protein